MSYSQLGQDLKVVEFYNSKKNGFFIEIGASDGISFSNTYLLESEYNWRGICIEPIPNKYNELINNRPNSICCNLPVYNETGLSVNFDISNICHLISGISINLDTNKEVIDMNKTTIQLNTISLLDLLDNNNAPSFIEYISLDTEGSEYEILRTFNFDKYTFGLIDVEHNYVEPRRTQIKELLLSKGYVYLGENKFDDMYKHNSLNN